ncbi:MAG: hypothetical protein ACI36Z_00555 [Alloprevotella sp.]
MKQDFKISKRFLWFNRIAFFAIYVFFVFLSFMFRGSDNHVYDIVYLLFFYSSFYYIYVGRMKLQIAGKELHYKPYNRLVFRSEELDGDCRCDVVRRWGVDAVRISTSDGSLTVYPEDIPAFLQAVREI